MRNTSTPATHHPYHFDDLSPDDFERLVYWLLRRSAEFDAVQWYGGAGVFERAPRISEKSLPPDHPNIRTVRGNLESLV